MDTATPARLREIVDELLSTAGLTAHQRALLDEARKALAPRGITGVVHLRHDSHTAPEPAVVTLSRPEVRP